MNKKMQRLLISLVVGLLVIVLAVSIILTVINNRDHRLILEESVESKLISISIAARNVIDIERFVTYNTEADVRGDINAYINTLGELRNLQRLVGATNIRALRYINGNYYMIFDTDPFPHPNDPTRDDTIFDEYEFITQVHLDAFSGKASAEIMNFADGVNYFNTGAVPIMLGGQVIGIIVTDIEDRYIQESQQAAILNIIILVAILTLIMGVNIVIIRRLIVNPISRLTESVAKANIDVHNIYGSERSDEIGDLARKIKESLDDAQVANRAKSDFLATMSHEIRTPMNAILGITEMQLHKKDLDEDIKNGFKKIYTSGDMLLGIINDILDLSKIEAGKLELFIEDYEVASLISNIAQLNIMRIGKKPIEFELYVDENLPTNLIGDELRVKQILNNVLSNAFKYTDEGAVTFKVSSEPIDGIDETVNIIFSVSDTGQGMSKEQVDKLFEEYSQFNTDANRETEGTGLGMSITRNLVQLIGGNIEIESEPGVGSTFIVRLPQGKGSDELLGKEMADNLHNFRTNNQVLMKHTQIKHEYMPYGNVLVVDDVETNIFVATGLMAPYELNVDSADSGFLAIEKVENGKVYDIIFMDHMMPKMDGMETTKRLREMGYNEPIVALTANAVAGQAEVFLKNGFDDFLSKPIDIRRLNTVLNKLVRDKQPPEVLEEARKQAEEWDDEQPDDVAAKPAVDPRFVEIFVRDAGKSLAALIEVAGDGVPSNDEDMQTYMIHTHGLKSALANFGNKELSGIAGSLEQASRDNNLERIESETPSFLNDLRAFIDTLKPEEEEVIEVADLSDADMLSLKEKLTAVKTACEEYDESAAEEILEELRQSQWPAHISDLLDETSKKLLHSDFIEAATEIESFIQNN
ncbi:MAG: response regulator [Oscillospiraceae bacterium]|nr:response regulator [Oscillospiraceae bacterium]